MPAPANSQWPLRRSAQRVQATRQILVRGQERCLGPSLLHQHRRRAHHVLPTQRPHQQAAAKYLNRRSRVLPRLHRRVYRRGSSDGRCWVAFAYAAVEFLAVIERSNSKLWTACEEANDAGLVAGHSRAHLHLQLHRASCHWRQHRDDMAATSGRCPAEHCTTRGASCCCWGSAPKLAGSTARHGLTSAGAVCRAPRAALGDLHRQ